MGYIVLCFNEKIIHIFSPNWIHTTSKQFDNNKHQKRFAVDSFYFDLIFWFQNLWVKMSKVSWLLFTLKKRKCQQWQSLVSEQMLITGVDTQHPFFNIAVKKKVIWLYGKSCSAIPLQLPLQRRHWLQLHWQKLTDQQHLQNIKKQLTSCRNLSSNDLKLCLMSVLDLAVWGPRGTITWGLLLRYMNLFFYFYSCLSENIHF